MPNPHDRALHALDVTSAGGHGARGRLAVTAMCWLPLLSPVRTVHATLYTVSVRHSNGQSHSNPVMQASKVKESEKTDIHPVQGLILTQEKRAWVLIAF